MIFLARISAFKGNHPTVGWFSPFCAGHGQTIQAAMGLRMLQHETLEMHHTTRECKEAEKPTGHESVVSPRRVLHCNSSIHPNILPGSVLC
jgi:hypothetical protein